MSDEELRERLETIRRAASSTKTSWFVIFALVSLLMRGCQ